MAKTKKPKHTAVFVKGIGQKAEKIMFFNQVLLDLESVERAKFLVSLSKNTYQGKTSLSLIGKDYAQI